MRGGGSAGTGVGTTSSQKVQRRVSLSLGDRPVHALRAVTHGTGATDAAGFDLTPAADMRAIDPRWSGDAAAVAMGWASDAPAPLPALAMRGASPVAGGLRGPSVHTSPPAGDLACAAVAAPPHREPHAAAGLFSAPSPRATQHGGGAKISRRTLTSAVAAATAAAGARRPQPPRR